MSDFEAPLSNRPNPLLEHPALSRRALLQAGAVGLLGLGAHHLATLQADESAGGRPASVRARSVVYVFLTGGPSQLETFDLKPEAPATIRGEFQPIATSTPGMEISEMLPLLAQRSHHFALCRSLTHRSNDHDAGHQIMLSGRAELPAGFRGFASESTNWPSIAALANSVLRARNNLPPAVALPEKLIRTDSMLPWSGQAAGLLGSKWDPWFIEAAAWCQRGWGPCPDCYDGVIDRGTANRHTAHPYFKLPSLTLPADIGVGRFSKRAALLSVVDKQRRFMDRTAEVAEFGRHAQKVFSLLAGQGPREAVFDVVHADGATLDRYGRNKWGLGALLAVRMIEAGVSLVQLNFGKASTWDNHTALFKTSKDFLLPAADRALSALLDDLHQRGLLESTLVVVAGEFGRTPRINSQPSPGRDHWGAVQTVLFAGGGVRGGTVVGSSDRIGGYPATDPQTPDNMAATIYQSLGIPPTSTWHDANGRPHQFYVGEPIAGLF